MVNIGGFALHVELYPATHLLLDRTLPFRRVSVQIGKRNSMNLIHIVMAHEEGEVPV